MKVKVKVKAKVKAKVKDSRVCLLGGVVMPSPPKISPEVKSTPRLDLVQQHHSKCIPM